MDDKERNQFVDDLLDASLARYSSVTPRPGLEGRILANARAAQARRSLLVWAGWLAAGAAAALIVFGVFSFTHRVTSPAPPIKVDVVKPRVGLGLRKNPVTVPPIRQAHTPRRSAVQRARPVSPIVARAGVRLPMFPSPSPMTAQERLLVEYVRTTPAEVLTATPTENALISALEIKPLKIAPLETDETESKINQ